MLQMVNVAARLLSKSVSQKVQNGMDITIGTVTIPRMRHPMEWGEAVEGLAEAVVDNRVHADCADVRHAGEFLSHRILRSLLLEMKEEKRKWKNSLLSTLTEKSEAKDFYVPGEVKEIDTKDGSNLTNSP